MRMTKDQPYGDGARGGEAERRETREKKSMNEEFNAFQIDLA